jgi:hypothetical protein
LDTHVFALPSRVFIGKYDDEELKTADVSCADEGREPVVTPYDGVDARGRPEMVDVATGTSTIDAKPILYVNTSKGAKFTVKVTCTDTRASLLGQPLEYSFSFRHGVRATCGPRSWLLGTYDCGACLPRAAHDLKCKTAYSGCGKESTCRDGMIWKWRFEDKLDFPEGVNGDAVVQAMYNSGKQEYLDLLSMMNDTCAGIVGLPAYPILGPKAMIGSMKACERPYKYVCCTTPGFKEDCSETGDINNQECFMSAAENLAWCTTDIKCGESECGDSLCVEPDGCLPPTIDVGRRCRDGCTACNKEGVCVASADLENLQCDTQYTDSCMKYTCQGGVCKGALSSDIGDSCHIDGVRDTDPCGKYACSSSGCTYGPLSPLPTAPCDEQEVDRGDKICTQKYYCSPNGYCTPSNTDSDCKPKGGGGGTCDPKTNDGCNTPP